MPKSWKTAEEKEESPKKKGILWKILLALVVIGLLGSTMNKDPKDSNSSSGKSNTDNTASVIVADFSTMTLDEITKWAEDNNVTVKFVQEYSESVPDGEYIKQNKDVNATVKPGTTISVSYSMGPEPSTEYKNALKRAETYSKTLHMSKEGIYQQLVSEYGEGFPADAAKWAIEHLNADYKYNALKKAESYSNSMYMSKKGIYNQLISAYGENFTKEEAQYAIDNLDADYNKNALMKAKTYESSMNMSRSAIYDQLVSEYGEAFTPEEAQYAIDHLSD